MQQALFVPVGPCGQLECCGKCALRGSKIDKWDCAPASSLPVSPVLRTNQSNDLSVGADTSLSVGCSPRGDP